MKIIIQTHLIVLAMMLAARSETMFQAWRHSWDMVCTVAALASVWLALRIQRGGEG